MSTPPTHQVNVSAKRVLCAPDSSKCFGTPCINAVMYQDLFQFIGCIRNVYIGNFFSVQRNNARFEFLFVIFNQKLFFYLRQFIYFISSSLHNLYTSCLFFLHFHFFYLHHHITITPHAPYNYNTYIQYKMLPQEIRNHLYALKQLRHSKSNNIN